MLRHDTTGRQALLFFPGRRRSGRGHCGRRSRDEAQIGPKEVKASKRQRLQRERLQIIFVHLFFVHIIFGLSESLRSSWKII